MRGNTPVFVDETDRGADVRVGGQVYSLATSWAIGDTLWVGSVEGRKMTVQVDVTGEGYVLFHSGAQVKAQVLTPRAAELSDLMIERIPPDRSKMLLSPMPGLLVQLPVKVGDEVKAGQELCVVEAMKMENILRAERDGVIAKINVEAGSSLAVDQIILEFA